MTREASWLSAARRKPDSAISRCWATGSPEQMPATALAIGDEGDEAEEEGDGDSRGQRAMHPPTSQRRARRSSIGNPLIVLLMVGCLSIARASPLHPVPMLHAGESSGSLDSAEDSGVPRVHARFTERANPTYLEFYKDSFEGSH